MNSVNSMKDKEMLEKLILSNVMSKNSTLLFSIEQWELTRRLRNSGLTKEQICQAYDDLERMERDLGTLYNIPSNYSSSPSSSSTSSSSSSSSNNSASYTNTNGNMLTTAQNETNSLTKNIQNFQMLMAKNLAVINNQKTNYMNGTNPNNNNNNNLNNININNNNNQMSSSSFHHQINSNFSKNDSNSNSNNSDHGLTQSNNATTTVNNYFATIIEPELENKELENFRNKGEHVIHSEISFFVYKHDLKQSQIARMAGVNQAYVSKFLRGEFFDLSENGKSLIYKWYLRFLKNPTIYLQAHNIVLTSSNTNSTHTNELASKLAKIDHSVNLTSFANVTNTTYDTPKRTRFSFKPEHLQILEKSFIENQYPDQKKREELAKLCNEARICPEREKVSEQIITHWFQNKRKVTRKANSEDGTSKSPNEENGANNSTDNANGDSDNPDNVDFQNNSPSINYQDFIEDAHMTAFKTIMNRSTPSPTKSNNSSDEIYQ